MVVRSAPLLASLLFLAAPGVHADGSLDSSFAAPGGYARPTFAAIGAVATDVATQPDGKVVVVGTLARTLAPAAGAIARLLPDGTPDTGFARTGRVVLDLPGAEVRLAAAALQADGKLVVVGRYNTGVPKSLIARYDVGGQLDASFDGDGLLVLADDLRLGDVLAYGTRVLAVGTVQNAGGRDVRVLARLADGSPDPDFGDGGQVDIDLRYGDLAGPFDDRGERLALQRNPDALIVGGGSTTPTEGAWFGVARLDLASGALDLNFAQAGVAMRTDDPCFGTGDPDTLPLRGLAVGEDGRIAAGAALVAGDECETAVRGGVLAVFSRNGQNDTAFNGGGKRRVQVGAGAGGRTQLAGLVFDLEGRLVAVGSGSTPENREYTAALRIRRDGADDPTFGTAGRAIFDPRLNAGQEDAGLAMALQGELPVVASLVRGPGGGAESFHVFRIRTSDRLFRHGFEN